MGLASAKVLFGGSMLNVIPWGILALSTSFLARTRRHAWLLGGMSGFVVSASFLWFDNTDAKTLSRIEVLVPAIVVASLFGMLCGAGLGWLGWVLRTAADRRAGRRA